MSFTLSTEAELIPIEARCSCPGGGRRLSLRVQTAGLADLMQATAGRTVDPESVLLTYRCKECKSVIPLTLRDLYLAE